MGKWWKHWCMIFCNNIKSIDCQIDTCLASLNRKPKKKILSFTLIFTLLEKWTAAKNKRQENGYLPWHLCTDNRLNLIAYKKASPHDSHSSSFTLGLLLQLHETVLLKELLGSDSSAPTLHIDSTDICIEDSLIVKERSKYFWAIVHPILKSYSECVRSNLTEKCLFYSTEQKSSLGQPAE